MNLCTTVRTLALASMVALAILSSPALTADAMAAGSQNPMPEMDSAPDDQSPAPRSFRITNVRGNASGLGTGAATGGIEGPPPTPPPAPPRTCWNGTRLVRC